MSKLQDARVSVMRHSLAWKSTSISEQIDCSWKCSVCLAQTETTPLQFSPKRSTGGTETTGTSLFKQYLTINLLIGYSVIAPKLHNCEVIRLCSDSESTNASTTIPVLRPVTAVLTVEDMSWDSTGATVFRVLGMNEGFHVHQLEVDERSRHTTTLYGAECKKSYGYGPISAQDIGDNQWTTTSLG